jgi:phosphoribosylaminoimidazolecarboxamide formyltransferase/IMP cyclohydrolase
MQIRQVVALADKSQVVNALLLDLEQLGLQISNGSSLDSSDSSSKLIICDPGFEATSQGSLIIHQALDCGCSVLMNPRSYPSVLKEIGETGGLSEDIRRELAAYALYRCIEADARRLSDLSGSSPRYLAEVLEKVQDLRYGENWHQKAALYKRPGCLGLFSARKLNGREMSYNNVVDADAVLEMLMDLSEYDGVRDERALSVIVKHVNPCGIAYGKSLEEAYHRSFCTDPKSAFGGVIGFDRPVDVATAKAIGDSFVEVLMAPGFEPGALKHLTVKKPNRRILDLGDILERKEELYHPGKCLKGILGGILFQDCDTGDIKEWKVVTKRAPTDAENRALRFAWKVAKYVKSNSLVYTDENMTLGIGSGQVSRVDSARFGAEKAEEHGLSTRGSVAATDSFFPFRDGLDETFRAGATAVVHPGGSIRDAEVIQAADEHGMSMVFTGMRHFRH